MDLTETEPPAADARTASVTCTGVQPLHRHDRSELIGVFGSLVEKEIASLDPAMRTERLRLYAENPRWKVPSPGEEFDQRKRIVEADRRVYHVELKSVSGTAMASVSWRYPAELLLSSQPLPVAAPPPLAPPPFRPEQLNLRYRIDGDKPDWRPLTAFDDGRQVFIEMPEKIQTMEAPPLFVIGASGAELTNYRVSGRFYVVDRLFNKAELRLGSGWGQKTVQIHRQTPIAGGARG